MRLVDDGASAGQQHEPRSIPLGKIWSVLTSEVGGIFTQGTDSTTAGNGPTTSAVPVTMITTRVPVPVLTTTVESTVVETSFLTVRVTTAIPDPHPHTTTCLGSDSCKQTSTATNAKHTSLPEVVTRQTSSSSTIGPHQTEQSAGASSATASPTASSGNGTQKHAIIGGLSGAIAGLVLIGVLIIFFLRKRRRRDEESQSQDSMGEKGLRPILAKKWSELTMRKSVAEPPVVSRSDTPDFDGGLLRVSMENWPRPFAHNESFRESMGPRRLQVMNPDPSRPETPLRRSSESNIAGGFLRQPRSALALFLGANRSRGNSASGTPSRDGNIPTIAIDRAASNDHFAPPKALTPSFRSYPSVSSLPGVEQHPPEDPFLTPPDERDELPSPSPRRPGITPLQSAAGAASRTLGHLGSALNPFRSKSHQAGSFRSQQSRQSVSTFFSSSSAGDPFQLDRPSLYERSLRRAGSDSERPEVPRFAVYEGT